LGIDIVDSSDRKARAGPLSFSGFGINPTPNVADLSLLGAQASRLQVFNQESLKVLLKPYCIAFEYMQAGRLRSQQGAV
jgi:hypothetical protein